VARIPPSVELEDGKFLLGDVEGKSGLDDRWRRLTELLLIFALVEERSLHAFSCEHPRHRSSRASFSRVSSVAPSQLILPT
jgi:hypothetical protein